jgi:hypothetical protein
MSMLRVRKDVTLLRENGDVAIVRVRKGVIVIEKKGYMAIL